MLSVEGRLHIIFWKWDTGFAVPGICSFNGGLQEGSFYSRTLQSDLLMANRMMEGDLVKV